MRGSVTGLPTATPIGEMLPAVFQEDEFTQRFTAGLDDVIAPVLATLDSLPAYFDPWITPEDFLEWLATWVGVSVDENWPLDRTRAVVANAVELFRLRGTIAGLKAHVAIFSGGSVEIADSGGVAWSPTPGGDLPGEPSPRLAVRITVDDPDSVNLKALDALVALAKPAHVVHQVEVRGR